MKDLDDMKFLFLYVFPPLGLSRPFRQRPTCSGRFRAYPRRRGPPRGKPPSTSMASPSTPSSRILWEALGRLSTPSRTSSAEVKETIFFLSSRGVYIWGIKVWGGKRVGIWLLTNLKLWFTGPACGSSPGRTGFHRILLFGHDDALTEKQDIATWKVIKK